MMTEAQRQLHQALNAHKSDLEIEQAATSDCDFEERIEATRRVLKWLEQAIKPPESVHAASRRKFDAGEKTPFSGRELR